jgi:hypothetical protein
VILRIATIPSHYHRGSRPIYAAVTRLHPVRGTLQSSHAVLVTSIYNWEICAYLSVKPDDHCVSPDWTTIQSRLASGARIRDVLRAANASVTYADPGFRQMRR